MTLLLATGQDEFVVLAADRRISDPDRVINDEKNKIGYLYGPDARACFGFTGLAGDGPAMQGPRYGGMALARPI